MPKGEVMDTETGEVFTSKEVAVSQKAASGVMIAGKKFSMVKQVNVPTLKQETGETVAIRIEAPIRTEENSSADEKKAGIEKFINVVRVTELGSGQPFEYVCNAITADNLRGSYQNDTYVGKSFAIRKGGTVQGKRYKDVQIIEITAEEDQTVAA